MNGEPRRGRASLDQPEEDDARSLTRVVVHGAAITTAASGTTQLLTLAMYVVLARLISPAEFGIFAAGSLLVGVAGLISESGMLAVIVQRQDRVEEAASTAFVATVVGGLLLGLVALILAPVVGALFRSHEVALVSAALAGIVPIRQSMIVPEAILQRRFSFVRRVVVEPVYVVVFGVAAILGGVEGLGAWALVLATYAAVLAQTTLSWVFVRWRPRFRLVSFALWRELASFGRHVMASEALRAAQAEGVTLLIGRFLGTAALGQYAYALRIARQPLWIITVPTSYVLMPALSRIAEDRDRFRQATVRAVRIMGALSLPVAFLTLPLGTAVVVVLFGDRWLQAGHAVSAMFGLAAGGAAVSVAAEVWKSSAKPHWLPRTHGLGTALALAGTITMLPFGLTAVALGLSAAALCTGAYALWGVARAIDAPPSLVFGKVLAPFLAAAGMAFVVWRLQAIIDPMDTERGFGFGVLALFLLSASGLVVYAGLYSLLSPRSAREAWRVVRREGFSRLLRPSRQKEPRRGIEP